MRSRSVPSEETAGALLFLLPVVLTVAREPLPALHGRGITFGELTLMPVGVGQRNGTGSVESRNLFGGQRPSHCAKILAELSLIACTQNERADRGPCEQPTQSYLWDGLADLFRNGLERVHHVVQVFFRDLRAVVGRRLGIQAADFGLRRGAADLAGEPSPAQRAPDHRANFFFLRERHQFPLVVAAHQRVVHLLGAEASPAVAVRHTERLHQMPAGEIRTRCVAHLALAHKLVQGLLYFFNGRLCVEAVQVINVHVVCSQTAQTGLQRAAQMPARTTHVVRPRAQSEGGFGGDQGLIAAAFEGLAQYLFRTAIGVDVGGVEERDPGLQADGHNAIGPGCVIGCAPAIKEDAAPAERPCAKT